MKKLAVIVLIAFALIVVSVTSVRAQSSGQCAPHKEALAIMEKNYGEVPVARGLVSNGNVAELLVSEGGETWTIVATFPNGTTCIAASGKHWESLNKAKPMGFRVIYIPTAGVNGN